MNMSLQKSPRGVWVKKLRVWRSEHMIYIICWIIKPFSQLLWGFAKSPQSKTRPFGGFIFLFPPLICHVFLFVCDFWVCMHEHSLPWTSYSRKSLLSVSLYCIKETVVLIFFLNFLFLSFVSTLTEKLRSPPGSSSPFQLQSTDFTAARLAAMLNCTGKVERERERERNVLKC